MQEEKNEKIVKSRMDNSYFAERRTVRKFKKKEIDAGLLESILERAMKAPTTGNMQLYSVVVTSSEEGRKALAPLHFSQRATEAPVMLTVCADFNRMTRWCRLNRADAGYDNFLSFTSAFADAIIYAQQIVTIAESEGLGTCYLGTVTYNAAEIARLLELPELTVPVACIALGWPDEEGEDTERLPLRGIMHKEKYRKMGDEEVLDVYKVKEDFEPNKGYVEENGKENLAQVIAEVRYPRGMNEEFSAKLLEYLRQSGFLK